MGQRFYLPSWSLSDKILANYFERLASLLAIISVAPFVLYNLSQLLIVCVTEMN